jgi:hypothetical protein
MIRAAFALLTLAVFAAIDSHPAAAEVYRPWCVVYSGRDGAYTCIFTSFEQCMMTAGPGTGGSCVQNPWYLWYGPNSGGTTGQGGRARR